MSRHLLISVLLLYISVTLSVPFDEILQTPHFMVISQYKCETIIETNLKEKVCPLFLSRTSKPSACDSTHDSSSYNFHHLHLVRDTNAVHPPKLLYLLGGSGGSTSYDIVDIDMPIVKNKSKIATSTKRITPQIMTSNHLNSKYLGSYVTSSIYDNDAQLLYILTSRGPMAQPSPYCFVYGVRDVFGSGKPSVDLMYEFPLHNSITAKYYWSADPYSDEVYYSTSPSGDQTSTLLMVKKRKLPLVLRYGEDGIVVSSPHTNRLHYLVSGGIIFSYGLGNITIEGHDIIGYMRSVHNTSDHGIICSSKVSDFEKRFRSLPSFSSVIVVRDVDFCLLNGLDDFDCQKQKDNFMLEKGFIKKTGIGLGTIFLLVLIFILSILVILLLLCVCCMKRNLENSYLEERGQPMIYYPNYPNLPRNPSFLDDSVDTWRH